MPEGLQVWVNPFDSIMATRCAWRSLAAGGWKTQPEKEKAWRKQEKGEQHGAWGQRFSAAGVAPSLLSTHAQGTQRGGPIARVVFLGREKQSWEVQLGEGEPGL